MVSQEQSQSLSNFSLESDFPQLQKLKEKGYVGFGAIGIILNEEGKVLLIQESSDRACQAKKDRWSLVYETGKEGETPELTMLAGIGSELGFEVLSRLQQLENRTFGFDFLRFAGDTPSRSLISLYFLPSDKLTSSAEWGSEVKATKWIKVEDLLNLPDPELRVNVKNIIQELNTRRLLSTATNMSKIFFPQALTQEYLISREKIPDLFWKSV